MNNYKNSNSFLINYLNLNPTSVISTIIFLSFINHLFQLGVISCEVINQGDIWVLDWYAIADRFARSEYECENYHGDIFQELDEALQWYSGDPL